jgi:hypothetical protein
MRRSIQALAGPIVFALVALVGCASTNISSVWKDPAPSGTPFKKVMVISMAQDASVRRVAEDSFVRSLPKNVTGVASYTVLGNTDMRDTTSVVQQVKASGVDGAIVYRLVSVDKQTSYVPGTTTVVGGYGYPGYGYPYYGSFGGYYGYGAAVSYSPGYLVEEQIIQVEANGYSLADEKLVWSARSETIDPSSVQSLIDDVVIVTIDQMRRDKILP